MEKQNKTWTDLKKISTENQIFSYWEKRQKSVLEKLNNSTDYEISIKILLKLTKCFNDKEKYSLVYYLYKSGFQNIEQYLKQSDELNELKYELGRGLHHNRKYAHSKKIFNQLAANNFDTKRIDDWWDQSAYSSIREKKWIKTDVLPSFGRFVIMVSYLFFAFKLNEFLITTTIFILLFEIFEFWWYQFRVTQFLVEFENNPQTTIIKRKIFKRIIIELCISLIFYPIYFLNPEWKIPLAFIIGLYLSFFHYGLNYYYLPKLIGQLNRENIRLQKD